jgi:hypothetical protein
MAALRPFERYSISSGKPGWRQRNQIRRPLPSKHSPQYIKAPLNIEAEWIFSHVSEVLFCQNNLLLFKMN